MKYFSTFIVVIFILFFSACNKQPYQPKAYSSKAYIIGEEVCSAGSNYNYWLLNLLPGADLPCYGDTIVYKGVEYDHVVKTINLDTTLRQTGKQVSFSFNYDTPDFEKQQNKNCEAPNAESFLLVTIDLFNQAEIK